MTAPRSTCAVDDCTALQSKRQWCDRHYRRWVRHGDPSVVLNPWSEITGRCVQCGSTSLMPQSRKFCSRACQMAESRERRFGRLSASKTCVLCGVEFDLSRSYGRAAGRSNAARCVDCRGKARRSYRLAVDILAHYQGTDCGICGQPIDMTVRYPDRRSASVDHKVTLADGGTDEVSNLQLAHFACNAGKKPVNAFAVTPGVVA